MSIVSVQIQYFRNRVSGGIELCGADDARMVAVSLPTSPDSKQFILPHDRAAFDAFMAGLDHGRRIGRWEKVNEVRAVWGDEPISHPSKVK